MAAGVRSSRSASAAAVLGPSSRIARATRSRVDTSTSPAALLDFHNTIVSLLAGRFN